MISSRVPAALVAAALTAGLSPATACAAEEPPPAHGGPPPGVRLLGEQHVPWGTSFRGTTVGGLSGLDFDPRTGGWLFISDDRSQQQPARAYTADVEVRPDGIGPLRFTGTRPLQRPDGSTYPEGSVDPEEIRFDPLSPAEWWTDEGDRGDRLVDPAIRAARPDGGFAGQLPLAPNLAMRPDSGPRGNEALEALTFAAGGSRVISAVESSLLQDGPAPTAEHGALGRITVQDRGGRVLAQHAYPIDPVFAPGEDGNNGVASVVADQRDPERLLVLERSYVSGVGNSIRIYEADLRGATDVQHVPALPGQQVRPVRKRLLADLSDFGLQTVDNVEGITWGPRLPTGERTLFLVSDNNFSPSQTTQLIGLAVR